jgi:hypothetical protein
MGVVTLSRDRLAAHQRDPRRARGEVGTIAPLRDHVATEHVTPERDRAFGFVDRERDVIDVVQQGRYLRCAIGVYSRSGSPV